MSDSWEEVYEEPMPRYALEEPAVGRLWLFEINEPVFKQNPESEYEQLMQEEPNDYRSETSSDEDVSSRVEHIVETILSDEERDVIQVTVFAGHSIRKASEILGWPRSTVHRLKQSALKIIERELGNVGENRYFE